jgi:hypothetical protein
MGGGVGVGVGDDGEDEQPTEPGRAPITSSAAHTAASRNIMPAPPGGSSFAILGGSAEQALCQKGARRSALTGLPFTFNVTWLYERGVLAHVYADGVEEKVPLPDGSLFISAGRVDFVAHGSTAFIPPDHGGTVD